MGQMNLWAHKDWQDLNKVKHDKKKLTAWKKGSGHKALPTDKKLSTNNSCWKRENRFISSGVSLYLSTTLQDDQYKSDSLIFSRVFICFHFLGEKKNMELGW